MRERNIKVRGADEKPDGGAKQPRKRRRRRRRKLSVFGRIIIFLFVLTVCVCAAAFTLKVSVIQMAGSTRYTSAQIIKASGIRKGTRLLFMNFSASSSKIRTSLPYIADARIDYRFPGKIRITVEADKPFAAVKSAAGYSILDQKCKVLESVNKLDGFSSIPLVSGVDVSHAAAGSVLKPASAKSMGAARDIYKGFRAQGIENITDVDVTNSYQLSAVVDNRVSIMMGTSSDLSYKIRFASFIVKEKLSASDKGTLDVSQSMQNNRVYFSPS